MAFFPRPAPKSALIDLRDFLLERRPHKFLLLLLACVLTYVVVWALIRDANTNTLPPPQIIWVKSIPPGQTDADIIAQQKIDLKKRLAREEQERRDWQALADRFGIDTSDQKKR